MEKSGGNIIIHKYSGGSRPLVAGGAQQVRKKG